MGTVRIMNVHYVGGGGGTGPVCCTQRNCGACRDTNKSVKYNPVSVVR